MKILAALFFCIVSFAHANSPYTEWSLTKSVAKEGQALVIHGLNTKPEKMREIINALNARGHDVLLLKLLGHNDDLNKMMKVTYKQWHSQIESAFNMISEKNCLEGGKISLVGFSLGGVLAMDMLSHNSHLSVHQIMLFSPALSVKGTSYLIKAFGVFGNGFVVPSFSPSDYRAQAGTTVAAYKALFDTIASFENGDLSLLNVPTVVFVDKKDELVSYKGIKSIVKKLNRWKIIDVNNSGSTLEKPYHHLTINSESLGDAEWNKIIIPEFDQMFGSKK